MTGLASDKRADFFRAFDARAAKLYLPLELRLTIFVRPCGFLARELESFEVLSERRLEELFRCDGVAHASTLKRRDFHGQHHGQD
jgi:hypothetical protein